MNMPSDFRNARRRRLGRTVLKFVTTMEASEFEWMPWPRGFRRVYLALRAARQVWITEGNHG